MRFGVRYTFEVRARRGEQRGAISRATAIPALADAVSRAPAGFVATWAKPAEAHLQWAKEAWQGEYEFRYTADDGVTWSDWTVAETSCDEVLCSSAATVDGNPEAYEFELRHRSTLNGDIAKARTGTHPSAPQAPVLLTSTPDASVQADQLAVDLDAIGRGRVTDRMAVQVGLPRRSQREPVDRMDRLCSHQTSEGIYSFTVMLESGQSKGQRMFQIRGTNSLGVGEPSNVQ